MKHPVNPNLRDSYETMEVWEKRKVQRQAEEVFLIAKQLGVSEAEVLRMIFHIGVSMIRE